MLKLKFQHFVHLMQRGKPLEKTLILGKIEGKRRRGQQRLRWLVSITVTVDMNLSKLQEVVKDRKAYVLQSVGLKRVRQDLVTEQQQQQSHGLIFPVISLHPRAQLESPQ